MSKHHKAQPVTRREVLRIVQAARDEILSAIVHSVHTDVIAAPPSGGDDTAAFQRALDLAGKTRGDATVHLQPGVYSVRGIHLADVEPAEDAG